MEILVLRLRAAMPYPLYAWAVRPCVATMALTGGSSRCLSYREAHTAWQTCILPEVEWPRLWCAYPIRQVGALCADTAET
jgi:hypothetical protein